ncbi:MAG: hypothetical protein KDD62_11210, partial [Bdellovibrionales bacterium]|nr:hypothetical protein [Bdellovibrionales bacterium]
MQSITHIYYFLHEKVLLEDRLAVLAELLNITPTALAPTDDFPCLESLYVISGADDSINKRLIQKALDGQIFLDVEALVFLRRLRETLFQDHPDYWLA